MGHSAHDGNLALLEDTLHIAYRPWVANGTETVSRLYCAACIQQLAAETMWCMHWPFWGHLSTQHDSRQHAVMQEIALQLPLTET